jgi:hypothetical protein
VVFDEMIAAALKVSQLPGAEARSRTLQLLNDLFPSWFAPRVRALFALFPMWFVARHASVFSVLLTYWLVGKSEIQDVDPDLLDPDPSRGERFGNTPSGWVPGFALGPTWRADPGVSQVSPPFDPRSPNSLAPFCTFVCERGPVVGVWRLRTLKTGGDEVQVADPGQNLSRSSIPRALRPLTPEPAHPGCFRGAMPSARDFWLRLCLCQCLQGPHPAILQRGPSSLPSDSSLSIRSESRTSPMSCVSPPSPRLSPPLSPHIISPGQGSTGETGSNLENTRGPASRLACP